MAHPETRRIALSKTRLVLMLVGAIAFVALGAWLLSLDGATIAAQRRFNNPLVMHGVGIAVVVFFGGCAVFLFRKLFDDQPGLVFSAAGLLDNASGIAAGLVPWAEIEGARVFELQRQKMLVVLVDNPEKYIARGNALKQAVNRANFKMCGSPIAIPASTLKASFEELVSTFEDFHGRYGRR